MANRYFMTKSDFEQCLAEARSSSASEQEMHLKAPLRVAWRIRSGWDGMGESFFDELTPGQHAVVCFSLLHGAGDFASFGAYTPNVVPQALKAINVVGATEYALALQQAIEAFPGKKLPIFAEDWWKVMGNKKLQAVFDDIDEKLKTGKGMSRRLCDYFYDYAMKHPADFYVE